jgi:hypothetical protein
LGGGPRGTAARRIHHGEGRGIHTADPDVDVDLIERAVPTPPRETWLEIVARRARPGREHAVDGSTRRVADASVCAEAGAT